MAILYACFLHDRTCLYENRDTSICDWIISGVYLNARIGNILSPELSLHHFQVLPINFDSTKCLIATCSVFFFSVNLRYFRINVLATNHSDAYRTSYILRDARSLSWLDIVTHYALLGAFAWLNESNLAARDAYRIGFSFRGSSALSTVPLYLSGFLIFYARYFGTFYIEGTT